MARCTRGNAPSMPLPLCFCFCKRRGAHPASTFLRSLSSACRAVTPRRLALWRDAQPKLTSALIRAPSSCMPASLLQIIITADVLAGHPGAPGLVCDLLGSAAGGWCANRALAAGVVAGGPQARTAFPSTNQFLALSTGTALQACVCTRGRRTLKTCH